VEKVAATFAVPIEQVYLIRHRVTQLIKEEVTQMENELK
jgi:hypothetical protein